MTRRYEYKLEQDSPEMVAAERLDAIAHDLERIADAIEQSENL